jgi:hypothetical protein
VDDITTAVRTGWNMLGETNAPELNFHEDTKLLIAVGPLDKLQLIDEVLSELKKALPETNTFQRIFDAVRKGQEPEKKP